MTRKVEPDASRILLLGCSGLGRSLGSRGLLVRSVRTLSQLRHPRDEERDVRAIVIHQSAMEGSDLAAAIPEIREAWPLVDVLIWAPTATGRTVREALRAGASDVLLTTSEERCATMVAEVVEAQQLLPRVTHASGDALGHEFEGMTSRSPIMSELFETASQVASTDATVLILGETGTGKELLARAIHSRSGRPGRFVAVNCGAIPESLVDSELFGHVEGAFTGAKGPKEGLFRYADDGTLMLDEMGTIPLAAQYRLLRVLQESTVRPVGGHDEQPVDVRVIAATSSDLEEDVRRGRFREDLYYRLDVIRLVIPPLRERPQDIVYLFGLFTRRFAEQYNLDRPPLDDGFLDALVDYDWPGNVRQLENFTEQLLLTHPNMKMTVELFTQLLARKDPTARRSTRTRILRLGGGSEDLEIDTARPLRDVVQPHIDSVEKSYLESSLLENRGRVGRTAEQAGISRRTLLRKMQQHGIDKTRFREVDADEPGDAEGETSDPGESPGNAPESGDA